VNKDAPDEAAVYFAHTIENSDTVSLTQGGLILIALLAGGDYDSGVSGIGTVIAHGLARCGFGDTLIDAARTQRDYDLQPFLKHWRHDLRLELSTNSRGFLGRRYGKLAPYITDNFPSLVMLKRYLHPITTRSSPPASGQIHPPHTVTWRPREPTLRSITAFCMKYLGWDVTTEILKRFHANLWDGVCFRMLCMVSFCRSLSFSFHFIIRGINNNIYSQQSCMTQFDDSLPHHTLKQPSWKSKMQDVARQL
jgi:Holliday junction resolvase YEN1